MNKYFRSMLIIFAQRKYRVSSKRFTQQKVELRNVGERR